MQPPSPPPTSDEEVEARLDPRLNNQGAPAAHPQGKKMEKCVLWRLQDRSDIPSNHLYAKGQPDCKCRWDSENMRVVSKKQFLDQLSSVLCHHRVRDFYCLRVPKRRRDRAQLAHGEANIVHIVNRARTSFTTCTTCTTCTTYTTCASAAESPEFGLVI